MIRVTKPVYIIPIDATHEQVVALGKKRDADAKALKK